MVKPARPVVGTAPSHPRQVRRCHGLEQIALALVDDVRALRFKPPVAYVYNPLEYAWHAHRKYLRTFGRGRREILLVGMNPGPWGMAQTGVPFGEVLAVREWLGIEGRVDRPPREHPSRLVEGFACRRSEVSGARLWGWAREAFDTPERFFRRFFVANYCPLCFLESGGRNRTPDKLPAAEREALFAACDRALRGAVAHFDPRFVIGVGAFAAARAAAALEGFAGTIGRIPHPSPASPQANRGWASQAELALAALGVSLRR